MTQSWEPTALLTVLALVVAQRAFQLPRGRAVDCMVVVAGLLTVRAGGLPGVVVCGWLVTAAVAGDLVAYAAGRPPGRDLFHVLNDAHTWPRLVVSAIGAAAWVTALMVLGRVLGEVGVRIGHPGTTAIVVGLGCLLVATPRRADQPEVAGVRSR